MTSCICDKNFYSYLDCTANSLDHKCCCQYANPFNCKREINHKCVCHDFVFHDDCKSHVHVCIKNKGYHKCKCIKCLNRCL